MTKEIDPSTGEGGAGHETVQGLVIEQLARDFDEEVARRESLEQQVNNLNERIDRVIKDIQDELNVIKDQLQDPSVDDNTKQNLDKRQGVLHQHLDFMLRRQAPAMEHASVESGSEEDVVVDAELPEPAPLSRRQEIIAELHSLRSEADAMNAPEGVLDTDRAAEIRERSRQLREELQTLPKDGSSEDVVVDAESSEIAQVSQVVEPWANEIIDDRTDRKITEAEQRISEINAILTNPEGYDDNALQELEKEKSDLIYLNAFHRRRQSTQRNSLEPEQSEEHAGESQELEPYEPVNNAIEKAPERKEIEAAPERLAIEPAPIRKEIEAVPEQLAIEKAPDKREIMDVPVINPGDYPELYARRKNLAGGDLEALQQEAERLAQEIAINVETRVNNFIVENPDSTPEQIHQFAMQCYVEAQNSLQQDVISALDGKGYLDSEGQEKGNSKLRRFGAWLDKHGSKIKKGMLALGAVGAVVLTGGVLTGALVPAYAGIAGTVFGAIKGASTGMILSRHGSKESASKQIQIEDNQEYNKLFAEMNPEDTERYAKITTYLLSQYNEAAKEDHELNKNKTRKAVIIGAVIGAIAGSLSFNTPVTTTGPDVTSTVEIKNPIPDIPHHTIETGELTGQVINNTLQKMGIDGSQFVNADGSTNLEAIYSFIPKDQWLDMSELANNTHSMAGADNLANEGIRQIIESIVKNHNWGSTFNTITTPGTTTETLAYEPWSTLLTQHIIGPILAGGSAKWLADRTKQKPIAFTPPKGKDGSINNTNNPPKNTNKVKSVLPKAPKPDSPNPVKNNQPNNIKNGAETNKNSDDQKLKFEDANKLIPLSSEQIINKLSKDIPKDLEASISGNIYKVIKAELKNGEPRLLLETSNGEPDSIPLSNLKDAIDDGKVTFNKFLGTPDASPIMADIRVGEEFKVDRHNETITVTDTSDPNVIIFRYKKIDPQTGKETVEENGKFLRNLFKQAIENGDFTPVNRR